MILGVGTDLCEISRMERLLQDGSFLKRYFDAREQDDILSRGVFSASTMAANFAAKEAFAKALGEGFYGIPLAEVAVLRRGNGAPYLELTGQAAAAADKAGVLATHLSLTHEGSYALAFVILEGK
ncbi:MAG: holo-ACP synthase [Clostridiales bacterium]|nr:holo-ACP synthase [Clostridiales bacterium]